MDKVFVVQNYLFQARKREANQLAWDNNPHHDEESRFQARKRAANQLADGG